MTERTALGGKTFLQILQQEEGSMSKITISLPPDVYDQGVVLAEAEGSSKGAVVERAPKEYFERRPPTAEGGLRRRTREGAPVESFPNRPS